MGVSFPQGGDHKRSTTATGRAIFADSVRAIDPALTLRIEHTKDWRKGYIEPLREIVIAASQTPNAAIEISNAGLESAHRRFVFAQPDGDISLVSGLNQTTQPIESVSVTGRASREETLSIPYHGQRISGSDLRRQIDRWVADGIAEPSFGTALHLLMDNPDWLDLSGTDIAVLGAGAEMAPTRSLLRWGAKIHALELPRPDIWQRLIDIVRNTSGSIRIPISQNAIGAMPFVTGGTVHTEDDQIIAAAAGVDLLEQPGAIANWLNEIENPFVLGNYTYADGATHATLSMSADAIFKKLDSQRKDITLAFLATPTDVFMVPMTCVNESRRRWDARGVSGFFQTPYAHLVNSNPTTRAPIKPRVEWKSDSTTHSSPSKVRTIYSPKEFNVGAPLPLALTVPPFRSILPRQLAPSLLSKIEHSQRLTRAPEGSALRYLNRQHQLLSWQHFLSTTCAILSRPQTQAQH